MKPLDILQQQADILIEKGANQIIRSFQRLDINLSGWEGLNTWDEICVQVQGEYSFDWNLYEVAMDEFAHSFFEKLSYPEKLTIWYNTHEGELCAEDPDCEPGYNAIECQDLLKRRLMHKAMEWCNSRIRLYLESR